MFSSRSILGRWVFALVVCLLLCGIVSAEIPELLSLTDNTSNDFTIRKPGGRECTLWLIAAIHESAPLDASFTSDASIHSALTFLGAETISLRLAGLTFCASQIEIPHPAAPVRGQRPPALVWDVDSASDTQNHIDGA